MSIELVEGNQPAADGERRHLTRTLAYRATGVARCCPVLVRSRRVWCLILAKISEDLLAVESLAGPLVLALTPRKTHFRGVYTTMRRRRGLGR